MAKTTKESRAEQYREILAGIGIHFEDCRVLAFVLKQERRPELFHFGLMLNEPRPVYYLFESWDKYVNVIVPKNEENAAVIISIAKEIGAESLTPDLR